MPKRWCICVMCAKVEPMKEVAQMVHFHLEDIVAWAQTRQTNGFLEAINGLCKPVRRRARSFACIATIKTVIFLPAENLNFYAKRSCRLTHLQFNTSMTKVTLRNGACFRDK